ncbi:MAG: GspH/FimT family pseudopilin [Pseudomonadota bacterium]
MKSTTPNGFTLLNLLTAIVIISLLVSTGMPAMSGFIANNQANSVYQRLFSLVQYTRLEAVSYRSQVILCPSHNRQHCINDWNQELMIFVDSNDDEVRNGDEKILRIDSPIGKHAELKWKPSGSKRYIRFNQSGETRNQNGRLTYCLHRGEQTFARQIIMYRSGRARKASIEEAEKQC